MENWNRNEVYEFDITFDVKQFNPRDVLVEMSDGFYESLSALQEAKNHKMVKRLNPKHKIPSLWKF